MSIKYVLQKNNLVEEPDIYAAQVRISASVGLEEIADRIVDQGTTVRKADVLAVLENAVQACDTMLLDGMRINFGGLVDLFPKIKGSFEGMTDLYDPARHQVDVAAAPGSRLRKSFREQAAVERQETIKPVPSLVAFSELPAPATPTTLAAGTIGSINGNRLAFDETKADEGIYLIGVETNSVTKAATIQKNTAKEQVFLVPTTPHPGNFYLEVRTRYTEDGELRTGRFGATLNKPV